MLLLPRLTCTQMKEMIFIIHIKSLDSGTFLDCFCQVENKVDSNDLYTIRQKSK